MVKSNFYSKVSAKKKKAGVNDDQKMRESVTKTAAEKGKTVKKKMKK